MQDLLQALATAKTQFKPIKKESNNPFYSSKYATLDHILDCIEDALHKNGLTLAMPVQNGSVNATLYHTSTGQKLECSYPIPQVIPPEMVVALLTGRPPKEMKEVLAALYDPQRLGSTVTYARRYALASLLSLSVDEDDDGNSLVTPPGVKTPANPFPAASKKVAPSQTPSDISKVF